MNDLRNLIIFLSQFDLTSQKIDQIIDLLGEKASIKRFCKTKFDEKILKPELFQKMLLSADDEYVKTYIINQADRGIKIITKGEKDFPSKLFNLDHAPSILYYKGDFSLIEKPSLSVVGTRKPTSYGRLVTEKIVRDVAEAGIVIISGLAYGVDSIAHRKCLEVGGKTIAVLGSGFDHVYPTEHQSLADEIAQKGLIISEYRPKMLATKYSFPNRNRIIAGLGDGVLITEASLKSGTIHTKEFALDYGKEIYAVPGNIDNINSALTNEIIKTSQAHLVTCAKDILDDYVIEKKSKKKEKFDVSKFTKEEQQILSQLVDGAKSIDELTKNSNLSINIFNSYLTTLEIRGIIVRMAGGYIALN